jgi:DNA-binding Xre family transcriptional regulator
MTEDNRTVIIRIEPSKRLSEIMGYPYFIERKFTVKELLEKKVITKKDLKRMERGEIKKKVRVSNGEG